MGERKVRLIPIRRDRVSLLAEPQETSQHLEQTAPRVQ